MRVSQLEDEMNAKVRLIAIVEKTNTGFSAYSVDLPVFTTGETLHEIQHNLVEAFNLYFEDEGKTINSEDIQLEFDLKQFFQYYRVINARYLAKRIGMNPTLLSQYVQGNKKPSPKQAERILKGVQEIGRELSQLELTIF